MSKRAEDWTEAELNATGGVVFEREYTGAYSTKTLTLKKMKRNQDEWMLYTWYDPSEPHIFERGTISECRAAFKNADAFMQRAFAMSTAA